MTKCILILKVCYMFCEDSLSLFDGDGKTQPRISFFGATVDVFLNQIANKSKSCDILVENVLIAHRLDFINAVSTMLATHFILNAFIRKISQ